VTTRVIDASALLALLRGERGADKVERVISTSVIATVNFGEVVGYFVRHGAAESDIRRLLDPLPVARIPFDEAMAYATGLLLPATKSLGLSFGDRACLALAKHLGVPAMTADRSWKAIPALDIAIDCIR